jgi:hypothetical protein
MQDKMMMRQDKMKKRQDKTRQVKTKQDKTGLTHCCLTQVLLFVEGRQLVWSETKFDWIHFRGFFLTLKCATPPPHHFPFISKAVLAVIVLPFIFFHIVLCYFVFSCLVFVIIFVIIFLSVFIFMYAFVFV